MKVVGLNSKESQRNKKAKHPTKRSPCQMVRCGFILHFLRDYFINSSLHGLRYVAEDGRHWAERCIWIFLCTIAVVGALYTSSNIWTRYQTSPTMTVLESTNYQIEYLPFPAVTVCNVYHARWDKAVRFQETYLPDADNITINAFYRLVFGLSLVNFGDFDMITKYFGNSIEDAERLAGLNVTFLMMEVMSSCEELFVEKCWWRNMFYDCCSLFEMQKTEYGFCYSFNSETSQYRRSKTSRLQEKCRSGDQHCNQEKCSDDDPGCKNEDLRPRRTSTSGMWSGLRIKINTFPEHIPPIPTLEYSSGVIVFVTSPYDFPVLGTDVTSGSTAQISLAAQVTYTTPQVHDLSIERRRCLYENERKALGFPKYRHVNCIAECHRHSTLLYCNCTPFFFPTEGYLPVCDIFGLICLSEFNDIFNYEKPERDNPFFDDGQDGMVCKCEPDCDRMEYTSEFYVTQGGFNTGEDQVLLDVHFKQPTVVQYRTDVVFGWLDLTVSLGGIAGLFIGFSLLSGAELVYFLTFRLYGLWKTERNNRINPKTNPQQLKMNHPTQQNTVRFYKPEGMKTSFKKVKKVLPQVY